MEVLIVIVITTVGFLSLINLQIGTLHAVGTTKNMMQAVNMAEHFIETLKSEAVEWNADATMMMAAPNSFPNLRFVGNPVAGGSSGWIRGYLSLNTDKRVGPLGNNAVVDGGIANEIRPDRERKFCLHYRLTWVVPNYLIRADVRAMWLRDNANIVLYQDCPIGMEADLANVSAVTVPGTIMRNVFAP